MNINLNGNATDTQCSTLMELVQEKGLDPAALVAVVNDEFIHREAWCSFEIKDEDAIELLSFVGGG